MATPTPVDTRAADFPGAGDSVYPLMYYACAAPMDGGVFGVGAVSRAVTGWSPGEVVYVVQPSAAKLAASVGVIVAPQAKVGVITARGSARVAT